MYWLSQHIASVAIPHAALGDCLRGRIGGSPSLIRRDEDEEFCTHDAVFGRERDVSR